MQTGDYALDYVAERTDTVVLKFSRGKDSLATWLRLKGRFKRIVPIFHYIIPGLEFEEKHLRECEDFFETKIHRLPHALFLGMMHYSLMQTPATFWVTDSYEFEKYSLEELTQLLCDDLGLGNPWKAIGTRATDSQVRRVVMAKYGTVREGNRTFYPVADWKSSRCFELIETSGLSLPIDYQIWGRSFDGIDYKYLAGLREHFPNDYQRALEFFPMLEMEFFRAEVVAHV